MIYLSNYIKTLSKLYQYHSVRYNNFALALLTKSFSTSIDKDLNLSSPLDTDNTTPTNLVANFSHIPDPTDKIVQLSLAFNKIQDALDKYTHDENLQLAIEKYLFDNDISFSESKQNNNNLFRFNNQTKSWLFSRRSLLIERINKHHIHDNSDIYFSDVLTKDNLVDKGRYLTNVICTHFGGEKFGDFLISFFLNLVSKQLNERPLIQTDNWISMARRLTTIYIYNQYSTYCNENNKKNAIEWVKIRK